MEQMIIFIISAISTMCIGLLTNYIYDKIKNHSSSAKTKSGVELEIKIKFKKIQITYFGKHHSTAK